MYIIRIYSLSQWLNFKLFGITYLVGKIKFKLFFSGSIGWVSIYIYRHSPHSSKFKLCIDAGFFMFNSSGWKSRWTDGKYISQTTIAVPRKSKSNKLGPLGRIGNPESMDHPKDQPLCLVDWTPRVYVCFIHIYGITIGSDFLGNFLSGGARGLPLKGSRLKLGIPYINCETPGADDCILGGEGRSPTTQLGLPVEIPNSGGSQSLRGWIIRTSSSRFHEAAFVWDTQIRPTGRPKDRCCFVKNPRWNTADVGIYQIIYTYIIYQYNMSYKYIRKNTCKR